MYLKLQLDELKNGTYSSHYTENFYPSQFSCTPFPVNPHHFQRQRMFSFLHLEQGYSQHQQVHCAAGATASWMSSF